MTYLNLTLRIFSIMGLLLFLILITGRRKIGELPVFDFLAIVILGNVVGADIADPNIPHLPTAFAVLLIIGIQYLISHFTIKNRKFGRKVSFSPTVVIQNGKFIKANMENLKYSIENILMLLREKDVFDINEVEFAVVEDSGNISVLKKSQFQPLTPHDMNLSTPYKGMSIPLIIDRKVNKDNLTKLHLDVPWLKEALKESGIDSFDEVFYADINTEGKLYITRVIEPGNITSALKI